MSDFDFTKPQAPQPASPDGFDFTKPPEAGISAPSKPANSQFYNPAVAKKLFQAAGKEEELAVGQTLFDEADKASKGGVFSMKGASRMYYIAEGELELTIGMRKLDVVKAGEIVGEMAVISERPRSATATAKTSCKVYGLTASELQSSLAQNPEFALMLMSVMFDRIRFVVARLTARKIAIPPREAAVFDAPLLQQFEAALSRPNIVRYQAGQPIMRVGQAGIYMYVVKTGQVAIGIRERLVEIVNPGGTFGEMALVDQSPRVADAQAHVYSELLAVDRPSLLEAVKGQPAFAMTMLKAVVERLRHMNSLLG
ncbi:MAG TPA: cyclic nucleotide-binding domain-containing protein [Usitatibacter sp.]|jgi:CRP-like cAMP-binding protein|nr:cyclic nucleotide-binding domain-containing protein [Usitatibacter sp.]